MNNYYVMHPACRLWILDDEYALLFDPVRGQVLKIKKLASIILEHCDGTCTFQQIAATMQAQYGVPSSAVKSVLEKYLKRELVKCIGSEIHESTFE